MATPLNNSVLRAFEILSLIGRAQPEISAAVVSARLGMNNATAHRFLMTLEATGALRNTKRGYFALGPKIDELGHVSDEAGVMGMLIQPELDAISAELNESVMASKLSRTGPICVAVSNSARAISVSITVGTALPFLASAQGKLWLSELDVISRESYLKHPIAGGTLSGDDLQKLNADLIKITRQGFATNLGENEPDIAAISVPVRDQNGRMILSLSTFGPLGRFNENFCRIAKEKLELGAQEIGQLLI